MKTGGGDETMTRTRRFGCCCCQLLLLLLAGGGGGDLIGRPLLAVLFRVLLGVLRELLAVFQILLGEVGAQRMLGFWLVD